MRRLPAVVGRGEEAALLQLLVVVGPRRRQSLRQPGATTAVALLGRQQQQQRGILTEVAALVPAAGDRAAVPMPDAEAVARWGAASQRGRGICSIVITTVTTSAHRPARPSTPAGSRGRDTHSSRGSGGSVEANTTRLQRRTGALVAGATDAAAVATAAAALRAAAAATPPPPPTLWTARTAQRSRDRGAGRGHRVAVHHQQQRRTAAREDGGGRGRRPPLQAVHNRTRGAGVRLPTLLLLQLLAALHEAGAAMTAWQRCHCAGATPGAAAAAGLALPSIPLLTTTALPLPLHFPARLPLGAPNNTRPRRGLRRLMLGHMGAGLNRLQRRQQRRRRRMFPLRLQQPRGSPRLLLQQLCPLLCKAVEGEQHHPWQARLPHRLLPLEHPAAAPAAAGASPIAPPSRISSRHPLPPRSEE